MFNTKKFVLAAILMSFGSVCQAVTVNYISQHRSVESIVQTDSDYDEYDSLGWIYINADAWEPTAWGYIELESNSPLDSSVIGQELDGTGQVNAVSECHFTVSDDNPITSSGYVSATLSHFIYIDSDDWGDTSAFVTCELYDVTTSTMVADLSVGIDSYTLDDDEAPVTLQEGHEYYFIYSLGVISFQGQYDITDFTTYGRLEF